MTYTNIVAFALRHLRRTAITFAVLIPLMSGGILLAERDLIYRIEPERRPPGAAGLAGVTEQSLETSDGERLVVWATPARPGQPTLLYFHGNGELLAYRAHRIRLFQAEGWGVYMLAWRGYSGSTGKPSERANVADAKLAYDTLRNRGLTADDIVIYGESMGASIAVQTAVEKPARAVILEAPFTSMVATWRQFVPFLPVGLLLTDRYDTVRFIRRLTAPLLIMHGRCDRLVWFGQGQTLYAAAPGPKRFAAFAEAAQYGSLPARRNRGRARLPRRHRQRRLSPLSRVFDRANDCGTIAFGHVSRQWARTDRSSVGWVRPPLRLRTA